MARHRWLVRARVDTGELSPNAAAVEAGFRSHQFTIRVTTPESIAATLRRQLPTDVLAKVIAQLED